MEEMIGLDKFSTLEYTTCVNYHWQGTLKHSLIRFNDQNYVLSLELPKSAYS